MLVRFFFYSLKQQQKQIHCVNSDSLTHTFSFALRYKYYSFPVRRTLLCLFSYHLRDITYCCVKVKIVREHNSLMSWWDFAEAFCGQFWKQNNVNEIWFYRTKKKHWQTFRLRISGLVLSSFLFLCVLHFLLLLHLDSYRQQLLLRLYKLSFKLKAKRYEWLGSHFLSAGGPDDTCNWP